MREFQQYSDERLYGVHGIRVRAEAARRLRDSPVPSANRSVSWAICYVSFHRLAERHAMYRELAFGQLGRRTDAAFDRLHESIEERITALASARHEQEWP